MTPTSSRHRKSLLLTTTSAGAAAIMLLSGCGRSAPDNALNDNSSDPDIAGVSITSPDAIVEVDPATEVVAAPSTTSGSTDTDAGTETDAPSDGTLYTVVSGDTLSKISTQFGVSIADLAAANGLSDVNTLSPGQELVVPAPTVEEEEPEEQAVEVTVVTSAGAQPESTTSSSQP